MTVEEVSTQNEAQFVKCAWFDYYGNLRSFEFFGTILHKVVVESSVPANIPQVDQTTNAN